jgi:DNA-binding transcriptional LysR family regulator
LQRDKKGFAGIGWVFGMILVRRSSRDAMLMGRKFRRSMMVLLLPESSPSLSEPAAAASDLHRRPFLLTPDQCGARGNFGILIEETGAGLPEQAEKQTAGDFGDEIQQHCSGEGG